MLVASGRRDDTCFRYLQIGYRVQKDNLTIPITGKCKIQFSSTLLYTFFLFLSSPNSIDKKAIKSYILAFILYNRDMNTMNNLSELYIHALNGLNPALGLKRLGLILDGLKSPTHLAKISPAQLTILGIEPETAERIIQHISKVDFQAEHNKLLQAGIELISETSAKYPPLLKEVINRPRLLYVRGTLPNPENLYIAVVGTRKITNYGRSVIPYLIGPIIEAGVTVVSGLAYGVDSAVQQLSVEKGRATIAILGGGVDEKSIYPKEHTWLAQRIIETGGALVSEYPPGTASLNYHFVARNRIISGISSATVVVECDTKSGSLITAQYALEQNRTVFAVPGPIYSPTSFGPHNLIKMGARALTEPKDLFEELNLQNLPASAEAQQVLGDTPQETAVLEKLTHEPMPVDALIKQCGLPTGEVMSALTFLEMKGKIRNLGGQQYMLSR